MAIILVACLLTFALLSSAPLMGNVWLGLSHIAGNSGGNASTIVGAVGVIEGVKWGAVAAAAGVGMAGGVVVGLVVGA